MSFSKHKARKSHKHSFKEAPTVSVRRSTFDRSHTLKTTFDSGMLIPIFMDEVLPGDTFNLKMSAFIRMSTPLDPVMDGVRFYSYSFFVPQRLVWENSQKFFGEKNNPADPSPSSYTVPVMSGHTGLLPQSLGDYLGLPTAVPLAQGDISALPFRCLNLIYNDWFRDENFMDSRPVNLGNGPDPWEFYELMRFSKVHDYFTSALPWAQKGDPVPIPTLGPDSISIVTTLDREANKYVAGFVPPPGDGGDNLYLGAANDIGSVKWNRVPTGITAAGFAPTYHAGGAEGMTATSTATVHPQHSATINQLREAFQTQELLEQFARGGTRYIEILKSTFGVTSPDSRLQRAEYLGGGIGHLQVSPVPQTSSTDSASPQGHLGAFATGEMRHHGFGQAFVEHGFVFMLLGVRADLTYQQGLGRIWSRRTRLDYFWPAFANLGERPILNQELMYLDSATHTDNKAAWGYQESWADYRYKPSYLTGKFRSNTPGGSLDPWHLAQYFTTRPTLSEGFIQENAPFDRVVALSTEPTFIGDFYFHLICARPMPTYSIPGLSSHF